MRRFKCLSMGLLLIMALTACSSQGSSKETTEKQETEAVKTTAESATETSGQEASDKETTAESGTEEKVLIGYSPMTMVNPYFSAVGSAIEEVVAEHGAELVKFDPQMDASVQAAQIDDMISMGIKALLFIPVDSAGSRNIMQACKDAGVYVVNIDNVVNENDYDVVDAIVASDN